MSIKCTDIQKVINLSKPRMKYNSPANKFFDKNQATIPTGYIADKYGKNHGWSVCEHKWNLSDLSITYVLVLDQNKLKTKTITASKDDICKEFGWKSFKVINGCSIVPKKLSDTEIEAKETEIQKAIKATKKRDSKVVKTTEDPIVEEIEASPEEIQDEGIFVADVDDNEDVDE